MSKITAFLKEIVSLLLTLAVMLLAIKLVFFYVAEPFIVNGRSMDNTLQSGERLLMLKQNKIERFDVVVFPSPIEADKLYIKRVIGLPGDTIEYKNDQLILNGHALTEPYLQDLAQQTSGPFTYDFRLQDVTGEQKVPQGKLFVMGDNRRNSLDGRSFGFINLEDIVGEADLVHWPLDKIHLLDQYNLSADGQEIVKE
ncbi:signal peptidase I [Ignavigranum ruoffiae]|uniref:signal peptidase I n=1 Tax=Ignavigranum ruoffiae TaxID=89093 RepID=UPI002060EE97|nr:signal peptidase I [Ignavigranum ruoffiae]UPQ86565.1 signal peptidase I [Ignavigranum ruoffiae]